jgi:hypothetical protein
MLKGHLQRSQGMHWRQKYQRDQKQLFQHNLMLTLFKGFSRHHPIDNSKANIDYGV